MQNCLVSLHIRNGNTLKTAMSRAPEKGHKCNSYKRKSSVKEMPLKMWEFLFYKHHCKTQFFWPPCFYRNLWTKSRETAPWWRGIYNYTRFIQHTKHYSKGKTSVATESWWYRLFLQFKTVISLIILCCSIFCHSKSTNFLYFSNGNSFTSRMGTIEYSECIQKSPLGTQEKRD